MSDYWIQILIFTVALLFFCWLLLEYWYYRKEKNPEGRLYLASKAAFAFVHFWKAVDSAKEIPEDTIKDQAGHYAQGEEYAGSTATPMLENSGKEFRAIGRKKIFRRQM